MKRSEILSLIEGLYKLEIDQYPKYNPAELFAENLLTHLEIKGMLPPTGIFDSTGDYAEILDIIDYSELDFSPKWEPEDESDPS